MNLAAFRSYLLEKDKRIENIYEPIARAMQGGNYRDSAFLRSNRQPVNVAPPSDIRIANVIFPTRVHLLTTSVFSDRIYVPLHDWTDEQEPI